MSDLAEEDALEIVTEASDIATYSGLLSEVARTHFDQDEIEAKIDSDIGCCLRVSVRLLAVDSTAPERSVRAIGRRHEVKRPAFDQLANLRRICRDSVSPRSLTPLSGI